MPYFGLGLFIGDIESDSQVGPPSGLPKPDITTSQLGQDKATITTNGVVGATSYTYERDTSSAFSSPTTISSGTTDLSVTDNGPLVLGTTYFYRINATDGVNTSTSVTSSLTIQSTFTTSTLSDGGNLANNANPFTFTVQPAQSISAGSTLSITGLTPTSTSDGSITLSGSGASIFGSAATWTQSTGTLVLTVDTSQTLPTGSDTVVSFNLDNSASSTGVTSVNLSSTGFVTTVMSGEFLEASSNKYNIPDSTDQQPHATIIALSPTNPTGEVTVKFGSDTFDLYVWDGSAWYIYNNN